MAARPVLGRDEPAYPLRVCALGVDSLATVAVQAALREDPRLLCVEDPEQADVLVWDAGDGRASPGQEVSPPSALRSGKPWIALVPDAAHAPALLAHGAQGVLPRRAHAPSLAAAVVAVRLGLCVLDLSVAEPCLHGHEPPQPGRREPVDALTSREREVLEALALGLSNRVIAQRLGVSVHTVKFHVNAILAKLQVESRAGAVARALRSGLLRA